MPAKEVLQFYGLDSFFGKIWYGIKFLWRFFLDKLIFITPVKSWRTVFQRWRGVKIGKGVYIGHEVIFDRVFTDQISIGDYSSIGDRAIITAHANIPSDTILKKNLSTFHQKDHHRQRGVDYAQCDNYPGRYHWR